ncbi:MAG: phosphoribosylformylglycinamidine synthase subunit PurL [Dehalococcoidia bacterium]
MNDVSPEILAELSLTQDEYKLILKSLQRTPNELELGMFGILWSEHCGYKHSKNLLRTFPNTSPRVLIGPGEENAGAVSIGDGLAVVMKIESHNHPSAIEPYEGAATGVGGIVRDIFSMGARPIALLNALFFGPLNESPRNVFLFDGVVAGIGGYGNCIGIPDIGGQVTFERPYNGNPLVNAMCVGIAPEDELVRAQTGGKGNSLLLVGADTGRDGIHGATFASVDLTAESEERKTAVQVGNPFLEKVLLEACLEIASEGALIGMQDLGAGGLTSAVIESAASSGSGIDIDVALVPRSEEGMTPYEIMLSESQERMLIVVNDDQYQSAKKIFEKWDLSCVKIGTVIDGDTAIIRDSGVIVGELPISSLVNAPAYDIQGQEDTKIINLRNESLETLDEPTDRNRTLLKMLDYGNIASKKSVYRQYDHQVGNNTLIAPGAGDAAVMRIKGTKKGIALTVDVNPLACYLDPYVGGALAVIEAARNISCVGATPLAITDCLNFGNPERPEIAYQLTEAIRGMADACRELELPVISGNVSLYNESQDGAIYPTPTVGMVGLLEDVEHRNGAGFVSEGDQIFLLGRENLESQIQDLGGSSYLSVIHGKISGAPQLDFSLEKNVQGFIRDASNKNLINSAHDVSEGGLIVAIAESCIMGNMGASISEPLPKEASLDSCLFAETPGRIVVSVSQTVANEFKSLAMESQIPIYSLGVVSGDKLKWAGTIDVSLESLREAWEEAL